MIKRRVFVLGAGFSIAVSDGAFPDTTLLGAKAAKGLADALRPEYKRILASGTFEEQLSRLAEDQPDLSEAENLERRGLFVRLSGEIAKVLEKIQSQVFANPDGVPDTLLRLVAVLDAWRSTVITFNYDLLVEYAVLAHCLKDHATGIRALPGDLVGHMPQLVPPSQFGGHQMETFELLKLHGSLDWWWSARDSTGATMVRADVFAPGVGQERWLQGLTRYVVPPTALKSTFYANPLSTALWQKAADAIRQADELMLVGYSLPATDLVVRGMIRENLQPGARVVVVNPDAASVSSQLKGCGVSEEQIDVIDGDNCVATMVDRLELDASRLVGEELRKHPGDQVPCVVEFGNQLARVIASDMDGETLALNCEAAQAQPNVLGPEGSTPMTVADIKNKLERSRSPAVLARIEGTGSTYVVSHGSLFQQTGLSQEWCVLATALPFDRLPSSDSEIA